MSIEKLNQTEIENKLKEYNFTKEDVVTALFNYENHKEYANPDTTLCTIRDGFAHNCYDCAFNISREEFLEKNGNLEAWTETRGCCEVDQIRERIEENLHNILTDMAHFEKESLRLNKKEL